MEMETYACFDCLQRRIEADYSDRLNFIYGLSDSPLPFGSSAVIQMSDSSEVSTSQQFELSYIPYSREDCLSKYVDEFCSYESGDDGIRGKNMGSSVELIREEVSVGSLSSYTNSLDHTSTKFPPSSIGGGNIFLSRLGCETCGRSRKFSCSRTFSSLAPSAHIGHASCSMFEDIVSTFRCGSAENHILHSLSLLMDGKSAGKDSTNFLSLIGVPSFQENGFPGCLRHPNILPILGILKSSSHINIVLPKMPFTLENILHYSPDSLKSDWHMKLLIYQVLSALTCMHGLGISHGNLRPSSIMLNHMCWCWLKIGEKQFLSSKVNQSGERISHCAGCFCFEGCSSHAFYNDLNISGPVDWHSSFLRWWKGELSNFEYLLILNRLSGRRWGDHTFHTVMPWVVDFSVKPDENNDVGWRDLSKSKWRLAKGDEQLDFTYSTSEIPHHVSDECLSELAVCSYKARRLPLNVLKIAVRSVYEPNEYPSSMQRLYQWTPDECIPEFYCDPHIFCSLHPGMPDLAVPSWAGTPEAFIKLHRDALESEHVTNQLHHWIDITFGYKMYGVAAIDAKNVMLTPSISTMPRSTGRRQLFTQPHPPRQRHIWGNYKNENGSSFKGALSTESDCLQKLEEASLFCEKSWHLSPCYNAFFINCLKDCSYENERLTDDFETNCSTQSDWAKNCGLIVNVNLSFLENLEVGDENSMGYHELFLWSQTFLSKVSSKSAADDIFSLGCILAEIYLKKPLFNQNSIAVYWESGMLPSSMRKLPYHVKLIVEACIQKNWTRRPSAKCILESPYFPKSVKSSYLFLASFHILAKDDFRLQYAATFAKQGALQSL